MRKSNILKGGGTINIRKIRIDAGLTQEELAKKVGVDQSAVAQWESGKTGPRRKTLPVLAGVLGCTVDELLREENWSKESG